MDGKKSFVKLGGSDPERIFRWYIRHYINWAHYHSGIPYAEKQTSVDLLLDVVRLDPWCGCGATAVGGSAMSVEIADRGLSPAGYLGSASGRDALVTSVSGVERKSCPT